MNKILKISLKIALLFILDAADTTTTGRADILPEEIASFAVRLCKEPKHLQIEVTSVSSMINLVDYFEDMPPDDELHNCTRTYLDRLDQLRRVLTANNDDGCGNGKISLIENYHQAYVSLAGQNGRVAELDLIQTFFLHYAFKVSTICKSNIVKKSFVFKNASDELANSDALDSLDDFLHQFEALFKVMNITGKDYNNFFIAWNLFELGESPNMKPELPDTSFEDEIGEILGVESESDQLADTEMFRVKTSPIGADNLESLQHACSESFEPVYSKLVMPILRLAKLGLYEKDEPLLKELIVNKDLRRIFGLAHVCETVSRIEVIADNSLKAAGNASIKSTSKSDLASDITDDDEDEIEESEHEIYPEPIDLSLAELDELESLTNREASRTLVAEIMANRKDQNRLIKEVMKTSQTGISGKMIFSFQDKSEIAVDTSQTARFIDSRGRLLFWFLSRVVAIIDLVGHYLEKAFLAAQDDYGVEGATLQGSIIATKPPSPSQHLSLDSCCRNAEMIIVEYRVPMPFSAADYRIAQLYTIAKKSRLESADSKNGVRINSNEPYSNGPGGNGQYTNKTYYLANKLPDWLKRLLPESAAKLKEEAWNSYPYSKNKYTNSLMESKLTFEIESRYLDGPSSMANVFNLDSKEERARRIELIDVVNDQYSSIRKTEESITMFGQRAMLEFDPLFRAPLTRDWLQESEYKYKSRQQHVDDADDDAHRRHQQQVDANSSGDESFDDGAKQFENRLMTCYKLCRVSFPIWPLQSKVEQFIQQYCRDTIIESHRQTWLWQDEWTGMSLADIRSMESDTQNHLANLMCQETTLN